MDCVPCRSYVFIADKQECSGPVQRRLTLMAFSYAVLLLTHFPDESTKAALSSSADRRPAVPS